MLLLEKNFEIQSKYNKLTQLCQEGIMPDLNIDSTCVQV